MPDPWVPYVDPAARSRSTLCPLDGATFDIALMPKEELMAYGQDAPVLHSLGGLKVVRLSKTLVMKFGPTVLASEGETMRYVTTKFPDVRLPRVYRYFDINQPSSYSDSGVEGYIVMDYIDGVSLDTCWDELNSGLQDSVVDQVAAMINQLQSIHNDHPGVIGGGASCGIVFSDYGAGPFPTREIFQKWIKWKLCLSKYFKQALPDTLPLQCPYFVLVHGDLSPRNLILDTRNQVWLIDWGCTGFYPPIFEAAAVKHQVKFKSFSRLLLPRIYNNPKELAQLEDCSYGIHRVPFSLPPEMELESGAHS
ncbi:phosphotransferase family protein [Pseudovirgaria hyperparasitica]|uniref:EKC/KEOPS complex subunit BUD32 n=1 Tax=Pseudovirgaria hyperparasitica TaxID=470096 RepID=A0A6A6W7P2_9PEZI|nr:phosphotransferase family protein [Pseudovirgaria hyperparasitica]KAF2757101.1 phosphotransferase family protein [Pseudovirgaria hyperparasitica]